MFSHGIAGEDAITGVYKTTSRGACEVVAADGEKEEIGDDVPFEDGDFWSVSRCHGINHLATLLRCCDVMILRCDEDGGVMVSRCDGPTTE
jgi:hypothetical protein